MLQGPRRLSSSLLHLRRRSSSSSLAVGLLPPHTHTAPVPHHHHYHHNHKHTQQQYKTFATTTAATSTSASSSSTEQPPASDQQSQAPQPLFEDPRIEILDAALKLVPTLGWSDDTLAAGAASLGFPAVAHGMFGRGAIELVEYAMAQINDAWLAELGARKEELTALPSAKEKLHLAIKLRLELIAPHLSQWPQALALGLLPQNLEATAKELAVVADELCFISGDDSVDLTNWYAHRATVCSVYIATELFFLTDYSEEHQDTWHFLERRLSDLGALAHAPRNIQEGVLAFQTAASAVASAVASLAQPALWGALQQVPMTGTMVTVLQAALANLAAMAPPVNTQPFQQQQQSSGGGGGGVGGESRSGGGVEGERAGSESSSVEFAAPLEKDPYEKK